MSELLRDIFTDQDCDDGSSASSSHINKPITHLIRQFIDTTRNQQFLNELEDGQHQSSSSISSICPTSISSSDDGFGGAAGMFGDPSVMDSLTPAERLKISNRSQVMARQFFPDEGEQFIENVLKKSLNINTKQHSQSQSSGNGASMHNFLNTSSKRKGRINGGRTQYEDDINMVDSNSQYFVEQEGNEEQFMEGQMNEFLDNQNVERAYEKYLDMMRENLSITSIRSSTPEYQPEVPMQANPYAAQGNGFEVGMQLWQRGDVSKAILAFEAQVHHDPQSSDAWRMLGTCHAECDNDQKSIHALIHSVNADPQNLEALMDLGVGYTNELNNMRALVFLKSWIANHPSYAHLAQKTENDQEPEENLLNYFHFHQEVLDLFNSAVGQTPNDTDLHIVLGILHNISKSYDRAIEHFKSALELQPGDYSLWNKLGATLANSNSPKDAIQAYRNALQLKPNYVRAWINLGIAYANLKRYEEAVKFYLRALNMSPQADSVWQYLGMALTCMDRKDLVQLCKQRDVERFRAFFDF